MEKNLLFVAESRRKRTRRRVLAKVGLGSSMEN